MYLSKLGATIVKYLKNTYKMTLFLIATVVVLRVSAVASKDWVYDWFYLHRPLWMTNCFTCFTYNWGAVEGIFIGLLIGNLIFG